MGTGDTGNAMGAGNTMGAMGTGDAMGAGNAMGAEAMGAGNAMGAHKLTHINEKGEVRMVDVSAKPDTVRIAIAEGFIAMHEETLALIVEGRAAKGDVLACARVAGVMAAKQTSTLIPMCHPLPITKAHIECTPVGKGQRSDGRVGIHVVATTGVTGKTGIEMEALTAASVACLTIYDMCKAVDRGMEISDVRLLKKEGGKTGLWLREQHACDTL